MINITLIDASTIDLTTKVNIALSTLSVLLVIISVVTVIITLRQNHKMIENSNRAYLSIYYNTINASHKCSFLVLKNFGNVSAKIIGFESDFDMKQLSYVEQFTPFDHIVDSWISPNQSLSFPINVSKLPNNLSVIEFKIIYLSSGITYSESMSFNWANHKDILHLRSINNNAPMQDIAATLLDIDEKLL